MKNNKKVQQPQKQSKATKRKTQIELRHKLPDDVAEEVAIYLWEQENPNHE